MLTGKQDIGTSQMNVEYPIKLDSLNEKMNQITNEEITGTPFRVVGDDEHGYSAVLSNYWLTKRMKTKEEVIEWVCKDTWEFRLTVMSAVASLDREWASKLKIEPTTEI